VDKEKISMRKSAFLCVLVFCAVLSLGKLQAESKYELQVRAVAYCLKGHTASGTHPEKGTIAVDPKIIPLGSKIYVPGYGWGKALDCGGGIKGRIIDIWYPSYQDCINWGSRKLAIIIVPPPGKTLKIK